MKTKRSKKVSASAAPHQHCDCDCGHNPQCAYCASGQHAWTNAH